MTAVDRRVLHRLAVLRHAEEITGNVAMTCRYYGITRQSFYVWKRRYDDFGEEGLNDRSRRPHTSPRATHVDVVGNILYLRQHYHFGPAKIAMYLARYHDVSISHSGVWRILKRFELREDGGSERRGGSRTTGPWPAGSGRGHPATTAVQTIVGWSAHRPIGRGGPRSRVVSVASMDLARAATPLRLLLRIAFVAVVASALLVDLWITRGRGPSGPDSARLSALAIGAIAILGAAWAVRPRHVLLVATAASVISLLETSSRTGRGGPGFGFFTEFVVIPVFLAAVLVRPTRLRWPVAALVVIAAGAISLRAGGGPIRAVLATSMFVLLGAAVAAVVYLHIRENERRVSIAQARENERLDLARELHDVVGHHVTGIVVLAQASRYTGGAEPGSPADRALADIETAGVETLTSVRRLIGLLRTDPTTSPPPGVADIERIVEDLRTTHPFTRLFIDDAIRAAPVPAELATTIQRLAQEAATNVRRHGDPTGPVTFSINSTPGAFELAVENRMLHAPLDTGYGLVGMRERVDALGGTFHAGPDGEMWRIRAVIPTTERVP
jgi:signal transduction histidine kinase